MSRVYVSHTGIETQDLAASAQEAALPSPCLIVETSIFIERGVGGQANEGQVLLSSSQLPPLLSRPVGDISAAYATVNRRRPCPLFTRRLENVPQGPRMLREVAVASVPGYHSGIQLPLVWTLRDCSLSLFLISTRHLKMTIWF